MQLLTGFGLNDLALFALRLLLGGFFVLARFRWVYDPSKASTSHRALNGEPIRAGNDGGRWFNLYRRQHLEWKLCACGFGRMRALAAFVAFVEIAGGLGVVVGLFTPLAALGLLFVTLFATMCTAYEKVARQTPVDRIDWASCYLWLVEPHLIIVAAVLVLCGAGRWSLDALVIWWLS